jgi:putative transcriptional regulator
MRIEAENHDGAILAELGRRLERTRLDRNLSQEELALEAGVSKATVERAEAGHPTKSTSLIRLLRALGRLDALDRLLPEPLPSPIERLELRGRQRQRARKPPADRDPAEPWSWDEEPGEEGR